MMSKYWQDSTVEFKSSSHDLEYPKCNGIVVFIYGGTAEQMITKARSQFGLAESDWDVVEVKKEEK